jgi:hypothetical protein
MLALSQWLSGSELTQVPIDFDAIMALITMNKVTLRIAEVFGTGLTYRVDAFLLCSVAACISKDRFDCRRGSESAPCPLVWVGYDS